MRITEKHVSHWREHGYVLVEDFLTREELDAARANLALYMPTAEEHAAAPDRYRALGNRGLMVNDFPFHGDALNDVCTHPDLIAFMKEHLGTPDVALSHSMAVGKYAQAGDYDQVMHVDYHNNTLAYPKADVRFREIPLIVYYSDVTEDLGPTYVVSQNFTRDQQLWPCWRPRAEHPELYEHETPAVVKAGTLLLYSMRTFHRGSAFRATSGARFTHHLGFRAGAYRWQGQSSFQHRGGSPEMDRFIERATPERRELVGFPPAGHEYWDEETLAGIAMRYPNMDMTPYEAAVASMS